MSVPSEGMGELLKRVYRGKVISEVTGKINIDVIDGVGYEGGEIKIKCIYGTSNKTNKKRGILHSKYSRP